MKRIMLLAVVLFSSLAFMGCQSPKLSYAAPAPCLDPSGPSVAVMPIADNRTNRAMDKVLAKGYFNDVQQAIADELRSMNKFSSVVVLTNEVVTPVADLKLSPGVRRLEWEIPHYNALLTEAFVVGLLTGVVGGTIDMMTKTDVQGHSQLGIRLEQTAKHHVLLESEYSSTVTNRLKKGVCDTPKTKASMMVQALQRSLAEMKAEIEKQISSVAGTSPLETEPDPKP